MYDDSDEDDEEEEEETLTGSDKENKEEERDVIRVRTIVLFKGHTLMKEKREEEGYGDNEERRVEEGGEGVAGNDGNEKSRQPKIATGQLIAKADGATDRRDKSDKIIHCSCNACSTVASGIRICSSPLL